MSFQVNVTQPAYKVMDYKSGTVAATNLSLGEAMTKLIEMETKEPDGWWIAKDEGSYIAAYKKA
jgi:hypothetical protein